MDTFKRIAYLHQVQSLLNDINKEKGVKRSYDTVQSTDESSQSTSKLPLTKLNSFFGYLSKEIAMKHNIQILNSDEMRQFRCKRCFAQYDFHTMSPSNGQLRVSKPNRKDKKKRRRSTPVSLRLTCSHCAFPRKVIFESAVKTKYERLLAKELPTTSDQPKPKKNKKKKKKKC